jgi:hypothetical protein
VNTADEEGPAELSTDGLSLFFSSDRPGGSGDIDLWVATRPTKNEEWGEPANLGPIVNSAQSDGTPSLSTDGLHLFFHSNRPPSQAAHQVDLYMTSRRTISDPWEPPIRLGPPVTTMEYWEGYPRISSDATILYLTIDRRPGQFSYYDIWSVPILPVVDLNRDGVIDCADVCIMADNWGQNNPLCDIGPTPLGDGKVDAKDLEVLMRYWGQEVYDSTLIAHWRLDETSGTVAADSVGTNEGVLSGNPTWQSTGGKIKGALQFDGKDDCVTTGFVWNPAQGPCSVLAWVKGGAPGQVLLSQQAGAHWLKVAPNGGLMTELKSGRVGSLVSSTVVTDGVWHRVGLVWDGSNRLLYVDGTEAARDTLATVTGSGGGLTLGGPANPAQGNFWSGLIDDVRLYNRAVKP